MSELTKKTESGLVKYTPLMFIEEYNPATLQEKYKEVDKTSDIIKADNKSIAIFKRDLGKEVIIETVQMHLVSLCGSINVHKTLVGHQIEELAAEIVSSFYFMSLVEIAHVFRKAKRGDFGTFKFSLNQADVMSWFNMYTTERTDNFLKENDFRHDQIKNGDVTYNEDKGVYEKVKTSTALDDIALSLLQRLKENLPKPVRLFEKGEFDDLEKGDEVEFVDTSNNEELNEMKAKLERKYGK